MSLIRHRLLMAQSRHKIYADVRHRPLEFEVGDHVFLKVMPKRGVVRFGKCGKLSPRFIRPFEILERVGTNVYRYMRLALGKKGFLTQNLVPFDIPNPPPLSTKRSPNLLCPLTQASPSLFASARVSFAQAWILLHSSYGRGKPFETH